MTPKGHAIPSKTQLLSYGTPAFGRGAVFLRRAGNAAFCPAVPPFGYKRKPGRALVENYFFSVRISRTDALLLLVAKAQVFGSFYHLTKKEKAPAFPQGENRGRCAFTPCYAGGRLLPAAFRAAYCTTER